MQVHTIQTGSTSKASGILSGQISPRRTLSAVPARRRRSPRAARPVAQTLDSLEQTSQFHNKFLRAANAPRSERRLFLQKRLYLVAVPRVFLV